MEQRSLGTSTDQAALLFEMAWRAGQQPQIEDYLPLPDDPRRSSMVAELVAIDLERRLAAGEVVCAEDYLRRFRELKADHARLVDVVLAEYMARRQQVPDLPINEYLERFPQCRRDLEGRVPTLPLPDTRPAPRSAIGLAPGAEPMPGYRLVTRLGRGGFGEVWKALGPGGIEVALKFVNLDQRSGPLELRALQAIKNIRHINLVSIFSVWQFESWLVVAMELADRPLSDRYTETGRKGIPRRELIKYSRDTANVLDYLNKPRHYLGGSRPVGIQHCDIKPSNILLIGDGIKVGDFGLAQVLERRVTRHHGALTPAYAPPEFFDGHASRQSDQYSLAVMYCQLRGGRLLFTGTPDELAEAHRKKAPDLSMLPAAERPVVGRALAKDPRQRWPNCRAFIRALTDAGQKPPDERRPSPTPRSPTGGPGSDTVPSPPSDAGDRERLTGQDLERREALVKRFAEAWRTAGSVALASFLPPPKDRLRRSTLLALIKTDLEMRWRRKQRVLLEEYLVMFPELGRSPDPELILEEYRVRHSYGDRPNLESYRERFPDAFPGLEQLVEGGAAISGRPMLRKSALKEASSPLFVQSDTGVVLPFGGGYRLIERIGQGPFGEVWRARAPGGEHGGPEVAMKIISRPMDHDERKREEEALELVLKFRHPNLVPIQAYWPMADRLAIAMELADGTLRSRLKQCPGGIPVQELLRYFRDTAEALDFLHQHGVQHRDVKPENIMLLQRRAKLADFGLARQQGDHSMTASGSGTPPYMAPEVWQKKVSPRSDQYSLAVAYVELRRGKRPFSGRDLFEMMVDHIERQPDLEPLPEPEQEVLRKALSKDPAQRYASCQEFVEALERAVLSTPTTLAPALAEEAAALPAEAPSTWTRIPHEIGQDRAAASAESRSVKPTKSWATRTAPSRS